MFREFVLNHVFMCSILAVGAISLLLQAWMSMYLKSYVRASANLKTTKKKLLIQLKNQFEAMYGMNCQVKNTLAYVDKFLLKLRFLGVYYSGWEKVPFLSAGVAVLITVAGVFYGYINGAGAQAQAEILFACGIVLACLFIFFHIYGIKSKKLQIQIQLVDYLENYMSNRLTKTRETSQGREGVTAENIEQDGMPEAGTGLRKSGVSEDAVNVTEGKDMINVEEDMEMLKRLLFKVEHDREDGGQVAASKEEPEKNETFPDVTYDAFKKEPKESELELLEEFVQSFLA